MRIDILVSVKVKRNKTMTGNKLISEIAGLLKEKEYKDFIVASAEEAKLNE